jgi:hypothetical protein
MIVMLAFSLFARDEVTRSFPPILFGGVLLLTFTFGFIGQPGTFDKEKPGRLPLLPERCVPSFLRGLIAKMLFLAGPVAYAILFRNFCVALIACPIVLLSTVTKSFSHGKGVVSLLYFFALLVPVFSYQSMGFEPWDSPSVRAYFTWGRLLRETDRRAYSIEEYAGAIEKGTDDLEAFAVPSFILSRQGKHEEALAYTRKAVERLPASSKAHLLHADHLYMAGDLSSAAIEYRQAIELDSTRVEPYLKLGLCLEKLERDEEALALYSEALKLHPEGTKLKKAYTVLRMRLDG